MGGNGKFLGSYFAVMSMSGTSARKFTPIANARVDVVGPAHDADHDDDDVINRIGQVRIKFAEWSLARA
jgi:hypothetical protein